MSGARTATLSLYWPGRSALHRAPAWGKLAGLAVASAVVLWIDTVTVSLAVAAAAAVIARGVGVPLRIVERHVRPVVLGVLLIGAIQVAIGHWHDGVRAGSRLLALGALAVLFTLTTSFPAIVGFLERTLARLHVRPDRVFRFGVTVGVMLRSIEYLGQAAHHVLDARRARGLHRSPRAFAVPMVVAAGRFAHDMGEALAARGIAPSDAAVVAQPRPSAYGQMVPAVTVTSPEHGRATWTPRGDELGPISDRPPAVPPALVLEALAQCCGRLLHAHPADGQPPARWALAGLDRVTLRTCGWDRPLQLTVTVIQRDPRAARLRAEATCAGASVCAAELLMVPFTPAPSGGGRA